MLAGDVLARTGIDAVALKPAECDVTAAVDLPVDAVTIDYEGREHLPDPGDLVRIARDVDVRVTAPVRADGFDPLGDDSLYDALPNDVGLVLVAGHPAYLDERERGRAIAPRLARALDRADDAWIGTEGVERLALATGATQFELLSPTTERDFRALRAAGFEGGLAVYAPTVCSRDDDVVLDAVGDYVARRGAVRESLPAGSATDSSATGAVRDALLSAVTGYALTGDAGSIRERVDSLETAGVDHVVGYPARGVGEFAARA